MNIVEFSISNGVIYGAYPKDLILNEKAAKEIVEARIKFLGDQKLPALIDTSGVKAITKDARDYLSKPEASVGIVAAALLSKSFFSKYISNFFIKLSIINTSTPMRVFTNEKAALDWLEQFKKDSVYNQEPTEKNTSE